MKKLEITYVPPPTPPPEVQNGSASASTYVHGTYNEIDAIDYSSILQGGRNDVTKFLSHHTMLASWTQIGAL